MKTKQPMTLRQLCDAAALFQLQKTSPFTMTDINADGATLRVEFSGRVDSGKKRRRGQLYETSDVQFDCPDEETAQAWNEALNGGEKLPVDRFVVEPVADMPELKSPVIVEEIKAAPIADPGKPSQALLDAKMIFNKETGKKDSVRLRFSADDNGTIPYQTIPFPSVEEARRAQQEYAKEAKQNIRAFACIAP